MGLHEDIRAAAKEAKESVAAAADTGAEWAIEKLPRDVALLVDVLFRDSAFLDALECRGINIRRRPLQPRKFVYAVDFDCEMLGDGMARHGDERGARRCG